MKKECAPLWHTCCPADFCDVSFSPTEKLAVGSPARFEFQCLCLANASADSCPQNFLVCCVDSPNRAHRLRLCGYSTFATADECRWCDSACERPPISRPNAGISVHRHRQHEHKRHLGSKRHCGRQRSLWNNFFYRSLYGSRNSASRRERERHSSKPGQSKRQRFSPRDFAGQP